MSYQEELEKKMRERLEKSGQIGKMRAMITEASLQALYAEDKESNNTDQPNKEKLFMPSTFLIEAKSSSQGKELLANVHQFLEYLGLEYTARVFLMEADLSGDSLNAFTHNDRPNSQSSFMSKLNFSALTNLPHTDSSALKKYASDVGTLTLNKPSEIDIKDEEDSVNHSDGEQVGGEDTTYNISSWKKRSFVRANGLVSGQQIQLEYLTDCSVLILDPLDSITVDDCEGGELIIAACEGSVFLRNCKGMTVHVACKQLRTRDCANLNIDLFTTTDPVVEMSHHISFRPFHLRLPGLKKKFAEARLDPKVNRFVHVYDFTATEVTLPQPHFTVMYPKHGVSLEARHAEYGTPECPEEIEQLLKGTLLPAVSSESQENKSHDIKNGSKMWANMGNTNSKEIQKPLTIPRVDYTPPNLSPIVEASKVSKPDSLNEGSSANNLGIPKVVIRSVNDPIGRPPAGPGIQAGNNAATNSTETSFDDNSYSSFENESAVDSHDKYEVEEDDDDF
ncbi:unnamed protein product [Phytomonas sp. Hart1]|nr:unnamed protein product [Phytomonas sp. Hart1]|eukprot:CCW69175.1 unnamed protein product [Phytomonas sp. isolate Hart1]